MRRFSLLVKAMLATAAALAGVVVFAAAASAHVGTIAITCTGVQYSFTGFPSTGATISESVNFNGTVTYYTFDLTSSSGSNAIPISSANGDVVSADAHWTVDGGAYVSSGPVTLSGCTTPPPPCPSGTSIHLRWHYSGKLSNGSFTSGSWSATTSFTCPNSIVSMGPQAMEGNLQLAPGATLMAGYDFTIPGDNNTVNVTFTNPEVTFALTCPNGATPTPSTLTVSMPTPQTYTSTNGGNWYPSGDQSSSLVYQGSTTVPPACGTGAAVSFRQGGTFTTSIS